MKFNLVNLKRVLAKPITMYLLVVMILLAFLIPRLPIFLYSSFPLLHGDSIAYLDLVFQISQQQLPSFNLIGPGYPLYIFLTTFSWASPKIIVYAQQISSLFVVLFFVWSLRKYVFARTFASLAAILYLLHNATLAWEMSVYPDSLISSLLIFSVALAFLVFENQGKKWIALLAFTFVFLIAIRSSNVFVLPLAVLMAMFLWKKSSLEKSLAFTSLILIGLLSLSFYNYFFSIGNSFSFLTYERFEKYGLTAEAEQDIQLPDDIVNEILLSLPDSSNLYNRFFSWDLEKATNGINLTRTGIYAEELDLDKFNLCSSGGKYVNECFTLNNDWQDKFSTEELVLGLNQRKLIHKTLDLRLKTGLCFVNNYTKSGVKVFYSVVPQGQVSILLKSNDFINKVSANKGADFESFLYRSYLKNYTETAVLTIREQVNNSLFFKVYDLYLVYFDDPILSSSFFLVLFFLSVIVAILLFFNQQRNTPNYLQIVYLVCLFFGTVMVFALFSNPLPRYSFNVEFALIFLPLLVVAHTLDAYTKEDVES